MLCVLQKRCSWRWCFHGEFSLLSFIKRILYLFNALCFKLIFSWNWPISYFIKNSRKNGDKFPENMLSLFVFMFPPLVSLTLSVRYSRWLHIPIQPWPCCISDSSVSQNECRANGFHLGLGKGNDSGHFKSRAQEGGLWSEREKELVFFFCWWL